MINRSDISAFIEDLKDEYSYWSEEDPGMTREEFQLELPLEDPRDKSPLVMVKEFSKAMGQSLDPTRENLAMRMKLIGEEYGEAYAAWLIWIINEEKKEEYKENILKELSDLVYVVYGFAAAFGWDLDEAVRRVHESNMSKLGPDGKPYRREDGKILKGPNYKKPDLSDLV